MDIKKIIPIIVVIGFILIFSYSSKEDISINIIQGEDQLIVEKDFI